MSKQENLNCQQSKDQLDTLIEAMVEARLNQPSDAGAGTQGGAFESSFEPSGPLKEHLADCSECHNYQLANRVIIEAARALPRLEGDEALTQSILAAIDISAYETAPTQNTAATSTVISSANSVPLSGTPAVLTGRGASVLAASFLAFTLATSFSSGITPEAFWSASSWALALLMVAMLKPLIEGNLNFTGTTNSMAKA